MSSRIVAVFVSLLLLAGVAGAQLENLGAQNAVLEGIQLSSEPSTSGEAGEITVSCYFIFREKPSSFFYEVKPKDKQLVFEFNDVEKGATPIQSTSESPLKGFTVEQKRIDANADIRGLKPEWHDVVTVTFSLDAVPRITVQEEYSVVSFTYKWTTDPSKTEMYIDDSGRPKWLIPTLAGVGGAAVAGVVVAVLLGDDETESEPEPLDVSDRPRHTPYSP